MHIMQTKYPERLGHMVIINTHPLFQVRGGGTGVGLPPIVC